MTYEKLKPLLPFKNMSVRQLLVLFYLSARKEKTPLRLIASGIGIPKPGTSRSYDALCRYGLVKRERDENDRREVYAVPTDKGLRLVRELSAR